MTQLDVTAQISLFKKKRFLSSLSEDDFRDSVIRPLFLARGLEHGKDVCGPDEEGKDCYFWHTHPITGRALTVVQTKKGNLNLSSKPKANVLAATTQMETALKTEVSDEVTKNNIFPSTAILAASGTINNAARKHIVSAVNDSRLEFLDADKIINMIDDVMPELWNGIDADKLPYLKKLREKLIEDSESIDVSEIGINAGTPSPITDETFVQLYLHRYKTEIKKRRGDRSEELVIEEIKVQDILSKNRQLLLVTGEAGAGKTTALRRLAFLLINEALKHTKKPIPVFLEADFVCRKDGELAFIAGENSKRFSSDSVAAFKIEELRAGNVVVLIDGLDQLSGEEQRNVFLEKVQEFHRKYPKVKLILASRDYPFIHDIVEPYDFVRYQITPISFKQASRMIERLSKGESISAEDTTETLRRLENIHGLQLSPLLVTIFVATADYARSDIPANITELFKKYTEIMLGRWYKSKGVSQQYHAPLKEFVLKKLAFELHQKRETSMLLSECRSFIERELRETGHELDFEILFKEIVYYSGLLRVDHERVMFRHMLLQEFFAGRAIQSGEFLASIVTDVWWAKAIVFYFGENPQNKEGLLALRKGIENILGGDTYQAAVTVGLASQACYLMKTDDKIESVQWVVDTLARIKEQSIEEFKAENSNAEVIPALYYYLYGRDSVAGKIIGDVTDRLLEEIGEDAQLSHLDQTRLFWCLAGLIESRQLTKAHELIKKFSPEDNRLLLGLHFGSFYVEQIHVAPDEQKKVAKKICGVIAPKIQYLRRKVMDEVKGMLLEVQDKEVKVLDEEKEKGS